MEPSFNNSTTHGTVCEVILDLELLVFLGTAALTLIPAVRLLDAVKGQR